MLMNYSTRESMKAMARGDDVYVPDLLCSCLTVFVSEFDL